ncbi:MAG TPA: class I adenylate-forming enzyme family protein [Acidimicrobiales bacterium]|nr:class I adenylate-forming enzyme family protein [Acidimicrobiales bacterium]
MTTFEGPRVEVAAGVGALTLGGFLAEVVERFGPNEAVVLDDPLLGGETVRWSYERLGAEARAIGRGLLAAGVRRGDAVGVVMGNRPEAVAAIFGAALVGAVAAPMSTFSPRPELAHLIDTCEARVVLTQSELLGRRFGDDVAAVAAERPFLERVAVLGEDSWDELLVGGTAASDEALDERAAAVTPDDPALVIFSSGTTSAPKGILHGHRSPALQCWVQAALFARHPGSRVFSALPLFWTAGLNTAVGATLAAGGCWVAQETFDPGAALALLARERVTEPYTLPHQTAALAEHPDWPAADLSSLRCVYGKGAYARHPSVDGDPGWIMPVGWGMSETCAFVCAHPSDTPRERAKVGHGALLPGVRLRVVDWESGRLLGVGEEGELCVAGVTRMLRYLGRGPEDCFDEDGFFHTGDAGHVAADGTVHWAGRRTEMIKTGGANVSPAEVEVALRACPPVKLSRVVGIPDRRLDEVVVACIVLRDGEHATADDVRAFLRERLAAYKVPKHVLFFTPDEMPMTSSEAKVRDDALLELVQARLDPHDPRPQGAT